MTLGDYITWGSFAAGAFALLRLAYQRWQPTIRSFVLWLYYAIDDYVALWQETQAQDRPLPLSRPSQRTAQLPIATPQTTRNASIVIAPLINELATLDGRDPILLSALIESLARLVADGELTQTAAIKIGLGIPPGSRSPRYQAARAAIQAELAKIAPAPEPHPPIKINGERLMPWESDSLPHQEAINT